ncbi:MAG: hypothetical protein G01um101425_328 [Candidatus Peregrinibacteria bacterium Gr01-1014_25]|nr:MAG: hypothetical protein G01um101425_328 [Candidatus Peregrinibacteria bacterium Gr01-1014_25]
MRMTLLHGQQEPAPEQAQSIAWAEQSPTVVRAAVFSVPAHPLSSLAREAFARVCSGTQLTGSVMVAGLGVALRTLYVERGLITTEELQEVLRQKLGLDASSMPAITPASAWPVELVTACDRKTRDALPACSMLHATLYPGKKKPWECVLGWIGDVRVRLGALELVTPTEHRCTGGTTESIGMHKRFDIAADTSALLMLHAGGASIGCDFRGAPDTVEIIDQQKNDRAEQ